MRTAYAKSIGASCIACVLLGALVINAGCRPLWDPKRREKTIRIESTPPAAVVTVNGMLLGETPCEAPLPYVGRLVLKVLPPREFTGTERLYEQQRELLWKQVPAGATYYFDLRLEKVNPTNVTEIRHR